VIEEVLDGPYQPGVGLDFLLVYLLPQLALMVVEDRLAALQTFISSCGSAKAGLDPVRVHVPSRE
jgi:hypothetical protein